MLRCLVVALAALAASACSYGSAVDMAPMSARLSKPAAAPGDYCEVKGDAAPFIVVSSEDCVPITWDSSARTYTMVDTDDPAESAVAAVVPLGASLYLAQVDDDGDRPDRHQLFVIISKGDAFSLLPVLDDERLKELAEKNRRLTFANDRSGRPYIASGRVGHIKTFLLEAAKESLRQMKEEGEPLSVAIRDTAGAADHLASKRQTKDIEAVLRAARSMTPG